jgi:phospholipid-translocating ATPase
LNVITTIHQINKYIVLSIFITLVIYGLSLVLLRNYLNTAEIDLDFIWKVGLIVAVSWVPIFIARFIKRKISPSEEDKIKH